MEQKLKHKQLVTIRIPAEKISWYKKGKEILINGTLFDVESIRYIGGMAIIRGLYDYHEKELDKQLAEATDQNKNNNKNSQLAKILGFFFVENDLSNTVVFASFNFEATHFEWCKTGMLVTRFITVPTPPPLG